jgi:cytochrome c biogenesis protein CcmG/thiol:disulfide interchange protein DsbE
VVIYGVNYKDDRSTARRWLGTSDNPYLLNIEDPAGSLGVDLGVYGAPETFVIDAQGFIRDKYVGIVDEDVWRKKLAPVYTKLLREAAQ